ncbi:efflux RND transporter periplasmic adaptor subunit [uncultured Thiodictyon sp.]|uniref:efflux RND transporter periplasmic adaptor subunit n=1 Tax=uncultured Thiodictyon sp. TaxID=1846217 RepID=UPI0025E66770|nr:efflux RND transporter periplasmic adaptor subunit [uncultured Thiodictyon sp.]
MEKSVLPKRTAAVRATSRVRVSLPGVLALAVLLGACRPAEAPKAEPAPIRPVRVVTVEELPGGETVTLTGTVQSQDEVNLAFRVGGQLLARSVKVGDRVRAGQVVARLDAADARNALNAARASLAGAMARLTEARNTVARYEPLLPRGFVSRVQFDRAVEARQAAQAQVDAVEAQVATAENSLSYTNLVADGAGTVIASGAEPGEVVAAGRMVVQLARQGGRDAAFDVPARIKDRASADAPVEVVLSSDAKVRATGLVREVSPQADPVTRTFRVRVGLNNPPEAMRLGSTVTGSVHLGGTSGIQVPASALTASQGQPAVWVLNESTNTVALRNIDVARYELDRVLVAHGLDAGELVVTAGVQTLRPGQQVRLLGQGGATNPVPKGEVQPAQIPTEIKAEVKVPAPAPAPAPTPAPLPVTPGTKP